MNEPTAIDHEAEPSTLLEPPKPPPERTFTQSELEAIVKKRVAKVKRSAIQIAGDESAARIVTLESELETATSVRLALEARIGKLEAEAISLTMRVTKETIAQLRAGERE